MQQLTQPREKSRAILISDLHSELRNALLADESERFLHLLCGQRPLRECAALVEDGERVPHPAVRLRCDDGERVIIRCDTRFPADIAQPLPNLRDSDAVKVIALAP